MKSLLLFLLTIACYTCLPAQETILTGAEQTETYFPLLKGKRIGVLTNHTGIVGDEHLIDRLHNEGLDVQVIFAPEHGFRGTADAGEKVDDSRDARTGIRIYSLYKSKTGKPDKKTMQGLDLILFDLQDVGLRYYTYYISMYKMMDACAENQLPMIILDRPNPNGFYVDGPILDMKYRSGVGYLPIPIVHGMTLGELAQMINGEAWLPKAKKCQLTVIPCRNYTHRSKYQLPIAPSPNLPNMQAVYLYASTCFFEGTNISLGRGTEFPFQVYGSPDMKGYPFSFIPRSIPGAKNPPLLNRTCYGVDLREVPQEQLWQEGINLDYLIDAYRATGKRPDFFTSFFEKLTGVDYIREMISDGKPAASIRAMWVDDVEKFKQQRMPYLLYPE